MTAEKIKHGKDPYEPTPEGFHIRVENTLRSLQQKENAAVPRIPVRRAVVLAALLLTLAGAAYAGSRLGVLDFLTTRIWNGPAAEDVQPGITQDFRAESESAVLHLDARDLYQNENKFSLCVHISPKEPERYRLLYETDIGADGEHFDRIWWNGKQLSFDEWLPEGKQMLVLSVRQMTVGGVTVPVSMDWLPEEQGETFLLEAPWERARSQNATVNPDGTVTIRLELETDVYGIGQPQTSTLTLQVPAGQGFSKNEKEEAK